MPRQLPPGYFYGETLKRYEVPDFALWERAYPPGFKTPTHSHKRALLCFVIRGEYTETYGRRMRECKPSTLLFHPAEETHAEHFHDLGGHSFIIELEPSWLERIREYQAVPRDSAQFRGGILEGLMRRLYREFAYMDEVSPLIIEGIMLEIMGEISRRYSIGEGMLPPPWLRRAKEIIQERFAEALRLEDIAEAVGVHPVHLAQMFHKSYRCTIGDYIRKLRIEYACRELATSDTPIVDIALAAGFCDQSHFTRTFKRLTGIAPSQYRRSFRLSK